MKTKTNSIGLFLVFAVLTVLTGCKKEPEPFSLPLLTVTKATEITVSSALVNGSVFEMGSSEVTARGFCWSTEPEPDISDDKLTEGKGLGQFTGRITGLLPGTDYSVRAWAANLEGIAYGAPVMIRTPLTVTQATLVTLVPENITLTSVVSGGDITDIGGGEITERGICWSTDPAPTVGDSKVTVAISGVAKGRFTIKLSDLESGKKYFLRSYAINSAGVAYGPEFSFRTLAQLGIRSSDFPGETRNHAVTFSIENKVYVGFGALDWGEIERDLWEWDKVTDRWTRLADFPGTANGSPTGFAIGGKGYVFINIWYADDEITNEFWEYDPRSNRWTQKSNLPATGLRSFPVAFSLGSKGYIGLGVGGTAPDWEAEYKKDLWEWDQATDLWTKKADFPGQGRSGAAAFVIGNKGFVGTGSTEDGQVADFWEYDQQSDIWSRRANFSGDARSNAIGFSIGSKGYLGAGSYTLSPDENRQDFWEWDQALNSWTQIGYVAEGGYAESGGSVGDSGFFFASLLNYSQPPSLWTFSLTSDK